MLYQKNLLTGGNNQLASASASYAGQRLEIQGLRAIAVLLVIIYHVFPGIVPGGYVGVDVFFVISGYLISGMLIRESDNSGSLSLTAFYVRRIKRLLPLATVVLATVVLTSFFLLPKIRWVETIVEVVASSLYVENWLLMHRAVDYLATGDAASPLRHFWSLSVEEQFYVIWPLLIIGCAKLAKRYSVNFRRACYFVLGGVAALSLAWSMYQTKADPAAAYFDTVTRVWELAIGGLLALYTSNYIPNRQLRVYLGWLGVTGILVVALLYRDSTPFPGWAALLPVASAVSIILSGSGDESYAVYRVLRCQLFQYLGDISYGLYLWHWPVVVFFGIIFNDKAGNIVEGIVVIAFSIFLAHISRRWIENPVRKSSLGGRSPGGVFALGGGCIALCLLLASAQYARYINLYKQESADMKILARDNFHSGAASLFNKSGIVGGVGVDFIPGILHAKSDNSSAYIDGCHVDEKAVVPSICTYGDRNGKFKVLLVGDSHAAQWLPALSVIAEERRWKLLVMTKSGCPFVKGVVVSVGKDGHAYTACTAWVDNVFKNILDAKPDYVVTSQSSQEIFGISDHEKSNEILASGLESTWRALEKNGIRVIAIRNTPQPGVDVADCVSLNGAMSTRCATPRAMALHQSDPLVIAAGRYSQVELLDLTDAICDTNYCRPIVGNVLVYRDRGHLTATYARTVAPLLDSYFPADK